MLILYWILLIIKNFDKDIPKKLIIVKEFKKYLKENIQKMIT